MQISLPDNLPSYRVLTGPDDDAFCWRVSKALALGYQLHGGPAVTSSDVAEVGDAFWGTVRAAGLGPVGG
jgi:hypothetical protein